MSVTILALDPRITGNMSFVVTNGQGATARIARLLSTVITDDNAVKVVNVNEALNSDVYTFKSLDGFNYFS